MVAPTGGSSIDVYTDSIVTLTHLQQLVEIATAGRCDQWRFYVGATGAQAPKILPRPSQICRVITVHKLLNTGQFDTVVLLVVASQMMRDQPPPLKYFFLEPLLVCLSVCLSVCL